MVQAYGGGGSDFTVSGTGSFTPGSSSSSSSSSSGQPVAPQAPELLADNSIYQYKSEPVYDPKAKKRYLTWLGKKGEIYGREYCDETKTWFPALNEAPKLIMPFTRHPADRHNYASVAVAPNGRILVLQADHLAGKDAKTDPVTGKVDKGYALMLYTSPKPGSIDGQWTSKILWTDDQPAYPTMTVADNAIYLFMRRKRGEGAVWRTWQFSKSTDNGQTWSDPRFIVDTEDLDDGIEGYQDAGLDEIYSPAKKFYDPVNKRIAIAWNLAGGGEHNLLNRDLYMAYLSTVDDQMYSPTGVPLGQTVELAEMNNLALEVQVYASEEQDGQKTPPVVDYVHHVSYLPDGKYFVTYNNMSKKSGTQTIGYAKWTGRDWKHGIIEQKPFAEALSRYGSVQQVSGNHFRISIIDEESKQVRIKETTDAGTTWNQIHVEKIDTKGQDISCADFVLPYAPGFPQIMVTTYTDVDKHNYSIPKPFPVWGVGDRPWIK